MTIHVSIKFSLCKKKIKWSRYRPGVAQRVGRGISVLWHDRGTRRGWVVSSTPRPHFTPGKDPVPILQEAGWAPGPVWTGGKISSPPVFVPGPSSPVAQSLYRLSYRAHNSTVIRMLYIFTVLGSVTNRSLLLLYVLILHFTFFVYYVYYNCNTIIIIVN